MIRNFLFLILGVFLVGYGLLASRQTTDGEWLYPGRLLGDQIEYRLTPGDTNKVRLKLDWLAQKGVEVKKDAIANNPTKGGIDQKNFENLLNDIKEDIKKLKDSGQDVKDLDQTLEAILEKCPIT